MIELNFRDISKVRPYFSEKILRKLVQETDPYSKTRTLSAIVTDGTAILGLGNIGPVAGLPVMEGKSLLFKVLGDVDVVPFCIYPRKNAEEQITVIDNAIGNFRAINLQDIKAPECFIVERGMKKMKNLPIFHDDQHGTAIVVLAGLITALKLAKKEFKDTKFVVNGAGAAGATISRLILDYGAQGKNMIICDSKGAIYKSRKEGMNNEKDYLAGITNLNEVKGGLEQSLHKADVFIGVSVGGALKKSWIKKMNSKPIIFALANPDPEILPDEAKQGGAFIYASGRSDFENQINNSLVFPGIFKGIIKHNLAQITDQMKLLAAQAISKSLTKEASTTYIIPDSLDRDVTINIAEELGKVKK